MPVRLVVGVATERPSAPDTQSHWLCYRLTQLFRFTGSTGLPLNVVEQKTHGTPTETIALLVLSRRVVLARRLVAVGAVDRVGSGVEGF